MTLEWTPDGDSVDDWVATYDRVRTGERFRYSTYEIAPQVYRALVQGSKEKCLLKRGTLDQAMEACVRHASGG